MGKFIKKGFIHLLIISIVLPYFVQPTKVVAEAISTLNQSDLVTLTDFLLTNRGDSKTVNATLTVQIENEDGLEKEEIITSSVPIESIDHDTMHSDVEMTLMNEKQIKVTSHSKISRDATRDVLVTASRDQIDTEWAMSTQREEKRLTLPGIEATEADKTDDLATSPESTKPVRKNHKQRLARRAPGNMKDLFLGEEGFTTIFESMLLKDKNGKVITTNSVKPSDTFKLEAKWVLPEHIAEQMVSGDFYEFKLPSEFKIETKKGKLENKEGVAFGDYEIKADGTVRLTFNDLLDEKSEIHGTFSYAQKLEGIKKPGEVEIKIPYEDTLPPVKITVQSNTDVSIAKEGRFDKTYNPNKSIWTIDINQSLSKMSNTVVKDYLPDGLKVEKVSIKPVDVNIDGEITEIPSAKSLIENVDYKLSEDKTEIIFLKEVTQAYRIELTAEIKESKKPQPGYDIYLDNTASITSSNGKKSEASASIRANYRKDLTKSRPLSVGEKQNYEWTVNANYSLSKLDKGSTLTDTFDSKNMTLLKDTVILNKVMFDSNGEKTGLSPLAKDSYKIIDNGKNGFAVELLVDVEDALELTYQTHVTESVLDERVELSNTVQINNGEKETSTGQASQQNLFKYVDDMAGIDYKNREIPWIIRVNEAGYLLKNWSLTDTISEGQTFKKDSLQILDGGKALVKNVDYKVSYKGREMTIQFLGDRQKETNHAYMMTYRTIFDTFNAETDGRKDPIFYNHATESWTDETGQKDSTEVTTPPIILTDHFRYNGSKNASYNGTNKKVTWKVAYNFNHHELNKATLTDVIEGKHKLIKESVKLYTLTVDKDGNHEHKDEVKDASIKIETNKKGLDVVTVLMPDKVTDAYELVYETSLENQLIDHSPLINEAVFKNDGIKDQQYKASIKPYYAGQLFAKSGDVNRENSNLIDWNILVNPSQSTLDNIVVTDYPSVDQIIDMKTLKVYGSFVQSNEHIDKNDEEVLVEGTDYEVSSQTDPETGKQTFELKFLNQISKPYYVSYTSELNIMSSSLEVDIYNEAKITADNIKNMSQGEPGKVSVINTNADADGITRKLMLKKVNEDNEPLKGAILALWKLNKKDNTYKMLRTQTTDENGEIEFKGISTGDYKVIEVKAPAGYDISSELEQGKHFVFKPNKENDYTQVETLVNEKRKVLINKTNGHNEGLSDTYFNVLKAENKEIVKENIKTNKDGQAVIEQLEPGHYLLEEVKANKDYIRNTELIPFDVKQEGTDDINVVNYKGSAKMLKTDATGAPIENALFTVFESDKKTVIQENLRTNAKGEVLITDLSPGTYYLQEAKAAPGYILNTEFRQIDITSEHEGKPHVVEVEALVNYKGSAELIKTTKTGTPLKGAEFDVVASDGKQVNDTPLISDENGRVWVKDLSPGTYKFVETKAPAGYILNNKEVSFTIETAFSGQPTPVKIDDNFVNYQGAVSFKKVTDKGTPLSGAAFDLYDSKGDKVNTKGPIVSTKEGIVSYDRLMPGAYTFKEVKSASGYIVNTQSLGFTIEATATEKPATTVLTDFVNYKGSAKLTKLNEANRPLPNAIFQLVGSDKKTIIRPSLVTDEKGEVVVEDLVPGTYYFEEVKAPTGYMINTELRRVTIKDHYNGEPEVVQADQLIDYKGSVVLTKTDKSGLGLSGAEFNILDKKGQVVNEYPLISNEDGHVKMIGLAPGAYTFVETKAPTGYLLNKETVSFDVPDRVSGQPDIIEIETDFINYQGTVSFKKVSETGAILPGVMFDVFDESNQRVNEVPLVSDDRGVVTIEGLMPGNYRVIETKALEGYLLNTTPVTFTVENSAHAKPVNLELADMVNYQGAAQLTKTTEAGNSLSGATFKLLAADKKTVVKENIIADEAGKVTATGLAPGTYYFEESKAPADYIRNTHLAKVEINSEYEGKPSVIDAGHFVNYQGTASLVKTDESGDLLAGASFNVLDKTGKIVNDTPLTSDNKGQVHINNLAPGEYKFVEISAPTGFMLNTESASFEILSDALGKPETVIPSTTFINYKGSVEFTKTNEEHQALEGVTFNLYGKDGKVINDTPLVSDKEGRVYYDNLMPGEYTFKEVTSLEEYLVNTTPIHFTIENESSGKPQTVKLDSFINYQGSVSMLKQNEDGQALGHAVFKIVDTKTGEVIREGLETDETGYIQATHLSPGQYELIETKAPTGYLLNKETILFDIEKEAEGQPLVVEINAPFINYQGSAKLIKTDETGQTLKHAKFNVFDAEGNKVNQEVLLSNEQGEVSMTHLSPGKYHFVEAKAPKGYILNTREIPFEITDDYKGQPVTQDLGSVINYQGSAELIKTDKDGTPLAFAEFDVMDKHGHVMNETPLVSGEDGRVSVDGLAPGIYQFIETKAPEGYIMNTSAVSFEIAPKAYDKPDTVQLDKPFMNYKGTFEWIKTDEAGMGLKGAEFKLTDKEGKDVTDTTYISDETGKINVSNLAPGEYKIIETKAPVGYILNTDVIEFTIQDKAQGEPEVVKAETPFVNYQGSVHFKKVDSLGVGLSQAEFNILTDKGERVNVTPLHSDEHGDVIYDHLAPGTYTIVETKAPTGYELSVAHHTFVIQDRVSGQPVTVNAGNIVNKKIPETPKSINNSTNKSGTSSLPKTGEKDGAYVVVLLGLMSLLTALGIMYRKEVY